MKIPVTRKKGLTLTELLCVIAILAILLALYLPAIIRAFIRVKKFLHDLCFGAFASSAPASLCVRKPLVWCLAYSWCFAARDFGLPLGGSDEHTLQRSVRSEQRRGRPKELLPEGLRRKWPGASLLLSHRSLRICSFVAPRPRPFWAQRNTSYMRDTTLEFGSS